MVAPPSAFDDVHHQYETLWPVPDGTTTAVVQRTRRLSPLAHLLNY